MKIAIQLGTFAVEYISSLAKLERDKKSTVWATSSDRRGVLLTHLCPPFQHLLFERLTSLGITGAPIMPRNVSLSDSKCWNLVAKTQRWAKMG